MDLAIAGVALAVLVSASYNCQMTVNLVLGQSAGGLLRQACRQHGLVGEVRVVDDDLSVGPLQDDQTRNEWWAGVYGPYPEAFQPNLYAQWQSLSETLDRLRANEIIIWSSNSARDYVFERMAAHMLDSCAGDLFILRVPASGKLEGVPFSSPEAIARMERNKLALTADQRADWGRSFARDLRRSEGVRRLQQGYIAASFDDSLDQFLLERCPREWTKWYRVVGNAMADCDGQNLIGDTFFSWRLRLLVNAARVEAQGDAMSLRRPWADSPSTC